MRDRLAVALMIPEPWSTEIDGLRRAAGEARLERIAPHVTMVPPVNLPAERTPAVLDHVRAVAAGAEALDLALGPVDTFAPVNPVAYLRVDGAAALGELRGRLLAGPFDRPDPRPFVPHVTLATGLTGARISALVDALADYRIELTVSALDVLAFDGRWRSIARMPLAAPTVVGRGGLPLSVSTTTADDAVWTVEARMDGAVVGRLVGRVDGARFVLWHVRVVDDTVDVVRHLLAEVLVEAARAGCDLMVAPDGGAMAELLVDHGFAWEGSELARGLG